MGFGHARRIGQAFLAWRQREEGATAVEYGLIITLIAAAIVASVAMLGGKLHFVFVEIFRALPR